MAKRKAPTFEQRRDVYTRLYAKANVHDWALPHANRAAQCIIDAYPHLEVVSNLTGVPKQVLGLLQLMEAGIYKSSNGVWRLNLSRHLHNGDPLSDRTKNHPPGRPVEGEPPFTWKQSALDAIKYDGLDKVEVYTTELMLFRGEGFNGWGYVWFHPDVNTPYLWAGTTLYEKGKYISDREYDPEHVSKQIGIGAVIKCLDAKGQWLPKPEPEPATEQDQFTWCTEVFPEAAGERVDTITANDVAVAGSRSMNVLQMLKWKLGIGTGGLGVYEAMKFVTDGKDTIADVLEIADRHLGTILKLAGVSTLVMVGFAIFFLAEAARDGRYDPRKGDGDAAPDVA